jgi:hypothetical protein
MGSLDVLAGDRGDDRDGQLVEPYALGLLGHAYDLIEGDRHVIAVCVPAELDSQRPPSDSPRVLS